MICRRETCFLLLILIHVHPLSHTHTTIQLLYTVPWASLCLFLHSFVIPLFISSTTLSFMAFFLSFFFFTFSQYSCFILFKFCFPLLFLFSLFIFLFAGTLYLYMIMLQLVHLPFCRVDILFILLLFFKPFSHFLSLPLFTYFLHSVISYCNSVSSNMFMLHFVCLSSCVFTFTLPLWCLF